MILDGPDERGGLARGAQHRIHQVGGGRFAVSAGDSSQGDSLVWLAVKISRRQSQSPAAMFHLYPGSGKFRRPRRLADYRERAAPDGISRKPLSVGMLSFEPT